MRMISTVAVATLFVTGLAACGQSDEQFRASARQQIIAECRANMSMGATMAQAGVDANRYCTCSIDRFLQSTSTDQLRQISRNPNLADTDPNLLRAAEQCMREQAPNLGATPMAPAGMATTLPNESAEAPAMAPDENGIAGH